MLLRSTESLSIIIMHSQLTAIALTQTFFAPGFCLSGYMQAALSYSWRLLGPFAAPEEECRHYSGLKIILPFLS